MKYFNNITDITLAKHQYRLLAKKLHPDKGGSAIEFNKMRSEYKALLISLQQQNNLQQESSQSDILTEVKNLAKVLLKKQVPQKIIRKRINKTQSVAEKQLFSSFLNLLDNINTNEIK